MRAARGGETADLPALRGLALYLLSLHAVGCALLAWTPGPLPGTALAAAAGGLALAFAAGVRLAPRVSGAGWWARNRAAAILAYTGTVALGLLAAVVAPEAALIRKEVTLFAYAQAALLFAAAGGRSAVGVLAGAMVLVVLTSLRGGAPAAVAAVGQVVLQGVFLVFDHFARTLSSYPVRGASLGGAALRQAASAVLPVAAALTAFLLLAPPRPYAGMDWAADPAAREATAGAYRLLALLALMGGGGVYLAGRLLPRGETRPLVEEAVEALRAGDEVLPEPAPARRTVYPGARGAIVRSYLGFLARAERLGFPRPGHLTASEFASQLREPAASLATLTDLFVRARYGPDEPGEPDVRAAGDAAREVLSALVNDQTVRRPLRASRASPR